MSRKDRVKFAQESFALNRQTAERNLTAILKHVREMLNFRHDKTNGSIMRALGWLPYLLEKRKMVPLLLETRWKVRFYRKIEDDLKRGDLGSAIEALSLFAPREETAVETVSRVRTSPATIWAIQRSPHILRVNMLQLRDDLIKIQQKKPC